MAEKKRFGFVGTTGLVLMVASGTFACFYACFLVYRLMNGLTFEQSSPMLVTLLAGGFLPYVTGFFLFRNGKKISARPKH
jgi:hypothetical protein